MNEFISGVTTLFNYYKKLGDKSIGGLSLEQLCRKPGSGDNSIAIIIRHMSGNMLSRWTDFLTSDGEKPWRNRDDEFEGVFESREDVLHCWEEGWDCLFSALKKIKSEDLTTVVYIRNEGHSVMDAIHRQLAHYAYHTGQIVFLSKHWQGEEWKSLSIPPGKSKNYNAEKFSNPRARKHFTDDEV